jgi:hypothetical protein
MIWTARGLLQGKNMRTITLLLFAILAGCSKSEPIAEPKPAEAPAVADNPMGKLLYTHWQLQAGRIKECSVYSSTHPDRWAAEYATRTYRMLTMGRANSAELLVPIALTTDMDFFRQPPPSDFAMLDAVNWEAQYLQAAQICAEDLRLRGLIKEADAVDNHAALLR